MGFSTLGTAVRQSDVSASAVVSYSGPKVLRIMRSKSFLKEDKRLSISDFPLATEQHGRGGTSIGDPGRTDACGTCGCGNGTNSGGGGGMNEGGIGGSVNEERGAD